MTQTSLPLRSYLCRMLTLYARPLRHDKDNARKEIVFHKRHVFTYSSYFHRSSPCAQSVKRQENSVGVDQLFYAFRLKNPFWGVWVLFWIVSAKIRNDPAQSVIMFCFFSKFVIGCGIRSFPPRWKDVAVTETMKSTKWPLSIRNGSEKSRPHFSDLILFFCY